ncbi:MAG: four-carbon acid sugar kinase family protein, partial [Nocardioidaceae bacterium]
MSPDVVVIADDLTGAGDTAVQFTAAGWSTELQLHPADSSAEVVALTTDSRALSAERAAQRVAATARAVLERGGGPRIYKKIDSTLRGPVRAEVEAVLGVLGDDIVAVVCPAFPA